MDKTIGELIDELIIVVIKHNSIDTHLAELKISGDYPSPVLADSHLEIGCLRNQLINEIDVRLREREDNLTNSNL